MQIRAIARRGKLERGMAKNRNKQRRFSVVNAVKANARARLGTPPPGAPIPDRKTKAAHGPVKHKQQMEDLIERARRSDEV
jgi:hypothetical protein